MNYFELYPGDYLRDTTRLSLLDHGAYLRLMVAYYGEEQPLPADHAELYVITSAVSTADKTAVRKVADRYFPVGDDGLRHNNRADAEIVKAQKRIQTARENGAKNKAKTDPPGMPPGMPGETHPDTRSGEALHAPHATLTNDSSSDHPPAAAFAMEGAFEGHVDPRFTPSPVVMFAKALISAGISATSMNPELVEYEREGGTVEHLLEVVQLDKCQGKNATYIAKAARGELAARATPITAGESRGTRRNESAAERTRRFAIEGDARDQQAALAGAGSADLVGADG